MTNEIKTLIENIKNFELKYNSDKSKESKKELEHLIVYVSKQLVKGVANKQEIEQNTYIISNILPIVTKMYDYYLSTELLEIPQVKLNKSVWSILKNNNLIKKSNIRPIDYEISPYNKGLEKIFKNIVSDDDLRPSWTGINYEKGTATGTDGMKLLHLVSKGENESTYKGNYYLYSDIEKTYINEKKKNRDVPNSLNEYYELKGDIGQRFPDWKIVLPRDYAFYKEFDLDYLNAILLTIYKNKLSNPITGIVAFEFDTQEGKFYIGFNAELLSQLCESMIMAGQNRVNFYFSSSSRGVVLLNVNLKYPKSKNEKFFMDNNFGLIMPVLINLDKDYIEENLKIKPLIKYNDIYDFDIRIGDSPSYNLIEGENKPNSKKEAKTESKSQLYNQLIDGYELSLEIETDKQKIKMYGDLIDGYKLALELEDEEHKYSDGGNVNDEKNEKMKK